MKTRLFTLITLLGFVWAVQASPDHAGHMTDMTEAIGQPGIGAEASRTVHVDMNDAMRFTPAHINITQGETIRFVIKNSGNIKHEFVLGTKAELQAHYQMMMDNPEMEHSEDNMITLVGGQTGEIVWQFTNAGKVDFACLQPGHFGAGMTGEVRVVEAWSDVMTDGEVKKIDKELNKITLKHGAIKNLGMAGMTMVFRVKNPAMLDILKVGDKVKFKAEKINAATTVTEIIVVE